MPTDECPACGEVLYGVIERDGSVTTWNCIECGYDRIDRHDSPVQVDSKSRTGFEELRNSFY